MKGKESQERTRRNMKVKKKKGEKLNEGGGGGRWRKDKMNYKRKNEEWWQVK